MKNDFESRKEAQLRKTPDKFIFCYFLQCEIESGKNYRTPYREDTNPSYTIMYFEKSGRWKAKDWAMDEKYHDVFEMVKRAHKLDTFEEVLDLLKELTEKIVMYNRMHGYRAVHRSKPAVTVTENNNSYQTMDFTYRGERYWNFQSIDTDTLEKFDVKQVQSVSYRGKTFNASEKEVFAYRVDGSVKIYQPYNKAFKHTYVKKEPEYVFGMEQLPARHSHVVITGSEKEVMALYGMGIPAVAVESETAKLSFELVKELKSRFKGVFILYDNDKVGKEKSKELADEHNLLRLKVPSIEGVKDFTEWVTYDGDAGGQLYEQMADVVLENREAILEELPEKSTENDEDEFYPRFNPYEPYKVSWDTYVKPTIPTISINGIRIGSNGNISVIVSKHGSGKSSACEIIACKLLSPEMEICGIETPKKQKVLLVDTERTKEDVSSMFARICRRLGYEKPDKPDNLELWALIDINDPILKMQKIEDELDERDYGLVVLDGFGDFVRDVNNLQESMMAVEWMIRIANKYNLVVLTTLHTNPSNTKPRGHGGSELLRKAESVLSVESQYENGDKVFFLNTDIKEAKLRNADGSINMAFMWDENEEMMMPFEGVLQPKEKSRAMTEKEYWEIAKKLLDLGIGYTHKEIATLLAKEMGVVYDTARKNHLKKLESYKIVVKVDDLYYLNDTSDDEESE